MTLEAIEFQDDDEEEDDDEIPLHNMMCRLVGGDVPDSGPSVYPFKVFGSVDKMMEGDIAEADGGGGEGGGGGDARARVRVRFTQTQHAPNDSPLNECIAFYNVLTDSFEDGHWERSPGGMQDGKQGYSRDLVPRPVPTLLP